MITRVLRLGNLVPCLQGGRVILLQGSIVLRHLRTFTPIVSAHPYCARESHATPCHVMHRAHAKYYNEQMIRQIAIATALLGINDLGRPVTPTFLFRNRFYLQLSSHCPKMNKKSMWEVKKKSRFLSTEHGSCHCETMVAKCELFL